MAPASDCGEKAFERIQSANDWRARTSRRRTLCCEEDEPPGALMSLTSLFGEKGRGRDGKQNVVDDGRKERKERKESK
jgi:hypothetical protein